MHFSASTKAIIDKFCEQMVELTRHIPPAQFGRYLSVGALYTLFGDGKFAPFIVFDYPYVKDLVKTTMRFIENSTHHRAYNVCS